MSSQAVAIVNRDAIIEQVAQGKMLTVIARDLGIAAPNISKHLADDEDYKLARAIGAELRLHLAYERMEQCAAGERVIDEESGIATLQAGNLARAREAAFRAAAWFAEREFPDRWAPRPAQVAVAAAITIIHESK